MATEDFARSDFYSCHWSLDEPYPAFLFGIFLFGKEVVPYSRGAETSAPKNRKKQEKPIWQFRSGRDNKSKDDGTYHTYDQAKPYLKHTYSFPKIG
jgi:hypothetical protein